MTFNKIATLFLRKIWKVKTFSSTSWTKDWKDREQRDINTFSQQKEESKMIREFSNFSVNFVVCFPIEKQHYVFFQNDFSPTVQVCQVDCSQTQSYTDIYTYPNAIHSQGGYLWFGKWDFGRIWLACPWDNPLWSGVITGKTPFPFFLFHNLPTASNLLDPLFDVRNQWFFVEW